MKDDGYDVPIAEVPAALYTTKRRVGGTNQPPGGASTGRSSNHTGQSDRTEATIAHPDPVPLVYVVTQFQSHHDGTIRELAHVIGAADDVAGAKALVAVVATGEGEHPDPDEPLERPWIPVGRHTWGTYHRGWHYRVHAVPRFASHDDVMSRGLKT